MLLQYFVDAKRDTTIGTLKFFYQKNKIIVFKKKVQNKKIKDFFMQKKTKILWILFGKRKTKKKAKKHILLLGKPGGSGQKKRW